MKLLLSVAFSALLLAAPVGGVASQDAVKAVVDKARAALGGEDRLAKHRAATWKGKGTVRFMGQPLGYAGAWQTQAADQSHVGLDITIEKNTVPYAKVVGGDKVWVKIGQGIQKLSKAEVEELREEAYVRWLTTMLPLRDREIKLEPLGELRVGDLDTVGLKVQRKGRRPVDLYFDKTTGVLVKCTHMVREGERELIQDTVWSAFEMQDGLRRPTRVVTTRDGNPYIDGELSEFRLLENLDASVFAMP
jgi:hypothetical protein